MGQGGHSLVHDWPRQPQQEKKAVGGIYHIILCYGIDRFVFPPDYVQYNPCKRRRPFMNSNIAKERKTPRQRSYQLTGRYLNIFSAHLKYESKHTPSIII